MSLWAALATRREPILDAAYNLLWANGCCCVTVDDICARAHVLKGSLSESALLAAAIRTGPVCTIALCLASWVEVFDARD
jgi:hypothetical protein